MSFGTLDGTVEGGMVDVTDGLSFGALDGAVEGGMLGRAEGQAHGAGRSRSG